MSHYDSLSSERDIERDGIERHVIGLHFFFFFFLVLFMFFLKTIINAGPLLARPERRFTQGSREARDYHPPPSLNPFPVPPSLPRLTP